MAETSANLGEAIVDHTVGSSAGGSAYAPTQPVGANPWWLQMLEASPSATTSMAATAFRGSNTITMGGSGAGGRGIRQNINPRNFRRFGSQDIFNETGGGYTPFQFLYKGANWLGEKDPGGTVSKVTQRMGLGEQGGDLLSKGGWARATAGARVANMNDRRFGKTMQMETYDADNNINRRAGGSRQFLRNAGYTDEVLDGMDRRAVGQALQFTGTGRINSAISGFVEGARGGISDTVGSRLDADIAGGGKRGAAASVARRFESMGRDYMLEGAKKAGVEVGEEGIEALGRRQLATIAARGGRKGAIAVGARVGFKVATRAVPVIGWAMLAHDVAKVATIGTGALIKGGVKMANEAMISMRGGMRTGIMDQGFRDNSVSISSRARGVAAIQNSRLNARSVLGNEGAAMHAHFG